MRYGFAVLAALSLALPTANGQRTDAARPEIRPFVGAYVPMGAMRDDFRDAFTAGLQGAIELSDYWHFVGTIGWTDGKNRFTLLGKEKTYLLHYDIGVEANQLYELQNDWLVKPFGGLGVGARSFDYGLAAGSTNTCTTGYGAIGGELQKSVVALRIEARQYVTCFESPITGDKKTRTDGLYGLGFAYHFR